MFFVGLGAGVNDASASIFNLCRDISQQRFSTDGPYNEINSCIVSFFTHIPLLIFETHFQSPKEKKDFLLGQRENIYAFVENLSKISDKPNHICESLEELLAAFLLLEDLTDEKSQRMTALGIFKKRLT